MGARRPHFLGAQPEGFGQAHCASAENPGVRGAYSSTFYSKNDTPGPIFTPAGAPGRARARPAGRAPSQQPPSQPQATIRQMHCAPGLAGGVRTQKVVIWPPKNRYSGPLAPQQGRKWHPGGTTRKSGFSRFWRILAPGRPPPCPPPGVTIDGGWTSRSPLTLNA
eukprot:gene23935-biopygen10399